MAMRGRAEPKNHNTTLVYLLNYLSLTVYFFIMDVTVRAISWKVQKGPANNFKTTVGI